MDIKDKAIDNELKEAYLDYSMSVIVGRALPDIKDGLKPVHRRILFSMNSLGLHPNKPFVKSARIVGDVIGKYHPHGDTAAYDSLVRMTQSFSLRYPLVSGHGNFGSIDGFKAAAQRYTEARLSKISEELLADIDKDTIDFIPTFDGSMKEPVVLPAKFPGLLVNGASGIAVGMATNIPPHNMVEACDAIIAYIDNPDIDYMGLMKHIRGPDFPTGGIICGTAGIRQAYKTGRGKVVTRAKADIVGNKIIVTEISYQVNKSTLIESIADLVKDKRVEGISNIRDDSDKTGLRIVIDCKNNAQPDIVLNQLYKHTSLQTSFGIIMLALVDGQPKVLPLVDMLDEFLKFRVQVVTRRTQYDLRKAEERMHVLEGLQIALSNIDDVVKLIKASHDAGTAKTELMSVYNLSEIQAQSILDMKLQRLTSLETEKINEEHKALAVFAKECRDILASHDKILIIIKDELVEIKNKYGDKRRSQIIEVEEEITTEDLIEEEDVVVTLTHAGYVKRLPLETYKAQKRGGKGIQATKTKEEDFVEQVLITKTHTNLLFFTSAGKVHWLKAYMVPEGSRYAKGTPIVNIIPLSKDEKVRSVIAVDEYRGYLLFFTKKGIVKKTSLREYANPRKGGIIAINLRDDDDLVDVKHTRGGMQILIATKDGRAVRFQEGDVTAVGRNSIGVRGINIKDSAVVGAILGGGRRNVLTITEKGYGKLTPLADYRLINRGGSGVINIKITEKSGHVIGIKYVDETDEVMFISKKGVMIRTPVKGISVIGRNTQGVRLMRLNEGDSVVGLASVPKDVE